MAQDTESFSICNTVIKNERDITNTMTGASLLYATGYGLLAAGAPVGLLLVGAGLITQLLNLGAMSNQVDTILGLSKSHPEAQSIHREYAQARSTSSAWDIASIVTIGLGTLLRAPEFLAVGAVGFLLSAVANQDAKNFLDMRHLNAQYVSASPRTSSSAVFSAVAA
jgi:hypothetical protein